MCHKINLKKLHQFCSLLNFCRTELNFIIYKVSSYVFLKILFQENFNAFFQKPVCYSYFCELLIVLPYLFRIPVSQAQWTFKSKNLILNVVFLFKGLNVSFLNYDFMNKSWNERYWLKYSWPFFLVVFWTMISWINHEMKGTG